MENAALASRPITNQLRLLHVSGNCVALQTKFVICVEMAKWWHLHEELYDIMYYCLRKELFEIGYYCLVELTEHPTSTSIGIFHPEVPKLLPAAFSISMDMGIPWWWVQCNEFSIPCIWGRCWPCCVLFCEKAGSVTGQVGFTIWSSPIYTTEGFCQWSLSINAMIKHNLGSSLGFSCKLWHIMI